MIFTAALAAILATALAACGGEERLHPILGDSTHLQIQEAREYVTMTSSDTSRDPSDRINAIYQGGYELQHTSSDEHANVLLVFRKMAQPEEPPSPSGTTTPN